MSFEWHDPSSDYFCFLVEYNGELYARDMHFDKNNKVFRDVLIEIITPIYGFDKEQYLKILEKSIDNNICGDRYKRYLKIVVNIDEIPGIVEKIKEHKRLPDKDKIYGKITDDEDSNPYIEYEDNKYISYTVQICRYERGIAKYDTEDKDYDATTATIDVLYTAMKEKENMEIEFKKTEVSASSNKDDFKFPVVGKPINPEDFSKFTYPKFTNSDRLIPLTDIMPFIIGEKYFPGFSFAVQKELMRSMFLTRYSFEIKKVVFNGPVTNITWADGTTTVVKKAEGDPDDKETAIAYAYLKRLYNLIGIKDMDKHLSKLVKEGKENETSIKEKREKRAKKKALAKKKAAANTEIKKPAKPKKENK